MVRTASAAAFVFAVLAAGPALAQQDGASVFANQCQGCHVGPSSPLAPSLNGAYGSKMGSRTDFEYSPAIKAKGGVWGDDTLDQFLKDPQAYVPGTAMYAPPQSDDNRKALIGYLKTLKPDTGAGPQVGGAAAPAPADAPKP